MLAAAVAVLCAAHWLVMKNKRDNKVDLRIQTRRCRGMSVLESNLERVVVSIFVDIETSKFIKGV